MARPQVIQVDNKGDELQGMVRGFVGNYIGQNVGGIGGKQEPGQVAGPGESQSQGAIPESQPQDGGRQASWQQEANALQSMEQSPVDRRMSTAQNASALSQGMSVARENPSMHQYLPYLEEAMNKHKTQYGR